MDLLQEISLYFELKSLLIKRMNSLERYDINKTCEYFYARLFNILRGYNLSNINIESPNYPGIDLIDKESKIVMQVSSQTNKQKIQDAINKSQKHKHFHFYFLSIAKDIKRQRKLSYNVGNLHFCPQTDILDDRILISELESKPEMLEEIKELFVQFFPWLKYGLGIQFENEQYFDSDRRMLHDFFEYFSCDYMDEFLKHPERMRYEFCGSYSCWDAKWGMSSTYFMDGHIDYLMRDFWKCWSAIMLYNDYYSDFEIDESYPYFRGWRSRNSVSSIFDKTIYNKLLEARNVLEHSYYELITTVTSKYKLDLSLLSQGYHNSYKNTNKI